jgi:hypothetical protein
VSGLNRTPVSKLKWYLFSAKKFASTINEVLMNVAKSMARKKIRRLFGTIKLRGINSNTIGRLLKIMKCVTEAKGT